VRRYGWSTRRPSPSLELEVAQIDAGLTIGSVPARLVANLRLRHAGPLKDVVHRAQPAPVNLFADLLSVTPHERAEPSRMAWHPVELCDAMSVLDSLFAGRVGGGELLARDQFPWADAQPSGKR
jgi:hypothetical protein